MSRDAGGLCSVLPWLAYRWDTRNFTGRKTWDFAGERQHDGVDDRRDRGIGTGRSRAGHRDGAPDPHARCRFGRGQLRELPRRRRGDGRRHPVYRRLRRRDPGGLRRTRPRGSPGTAGGAGRRHHRSGRPPREPARARVLGGHHAGPHRAAHRRPPQARGPRRPLRVGALERAHGAATRGGPGARRQGDRARSRDRRTPGPRRSDLPGLRRDGRTRRRRAGEHRCPGRRRRDRGGEARREPRRARAFYEQGAHLRAAAAQAHRGVATHAARRRLR